MELLCIGFGVVLSVLFWVWLWKNRGESTQILDIQTGRRFWIHNVMLALPTFFVMILTLEFYFFEDSTWHQTTVEEPSQYRALLVYGIWIMGVFLPLAIPFAAFLYAVTRLPDFVKDAKIPYAVMLILWYATPVFALLPRLTESTISLEFYVASISVFPVLELLVFVWIWLQVIKYGIGLYKTKSRT
jgi:hypothetical protein